MGSEGPEGREGPAGAEGPLGSEGPVTRVRLESGETERLGLRAAASSSALRLRAARMCAGIEGPHWALILLL